MVRKGRKGCCALLHFREDNARFVLLFMVMLLYMLAGAGIFMLLEAENEAAEKQHYEKALDTFLRENPCVNRSALESILQLHGQAEITGIVGDKRPRWDFPGSFYFVGTVVSTIGFGMTTPRTIPGKIVLIFYGFFGCAGAILYFNLFLERIITLLAYILRAIHERGLRRKNLINEARDAKARRRSESSEEGNLDSWKPSVYWVMLILLLGATTVACCASAMYYPVEEWTYFEAVYFCFVTFATIGFGDYVVSQKANYQNASFYRLGNFIFIVIGCCCIYSLFNVTSIVIKQFLNWILRRLNCQCRIRRPSRTRRNAITPGHLHKTPAVTVTDADGDSESEYRRNSGEMISMRDFLQANKISLAMMQKQLWETSQQGVNSSGGFHGGVGPLAILNRKLGQDEFDQGI